MIEKSWVQLLVGLLSSGYYLDGWLSANR